AEAASIRIRTIHETDSTISENQTVWKIMAMPQRLREGTAIILSAGANRKPNRFRQNCRLVVFFGMETR
ncbi:hypothetical protein MM707_30985, partial [Klebsiella pneumoniae]|nr:hypothetical protein [Klebsiella pneumoniae]